MIDLLPEMHTAPPAMIWEAKKPKKNRKRASGLAVGAIIVLSDGTRCRIVAFDRAGRPICHFDRRGQP